MFLLHTSYYKEVLFLNRWESTEDRSAFYTAPSSLHQSSGSDLSNLRFQGSKVSGFGSGLDGGVMHPNSSASSADSYMDRSFIFKMYPRHFRYLLSARLFVKSTW